MRKEKMLLRLSIKDFHALHSLKPQYSRWIRDEHYLQELI